MQLIATHEVARGGISGVTIEQASLFRAAVVTGAMALILVHNPEWRPLAEPGGSRTYREGAAGRGAAWR
jgi:hypothetical protein